MNKRVSKIRLIFVGYLLLITVVFVNGRPELLNKPAASQLETRCGWLSNPTPANISLHDRDAEWTIGVQGGYQVEGDWEWPTFKRGQWVVTNAGSYGYGCVCMQLEVNHQTHEVVTIRSARARTLATCRSDRALRRWRQLFK